MFHLAADSTVLSFSSSIEWDTPGPGLFITQKRDV